MCGLNGDGACLLEAALLWHVDYQVRAVKIGLYPSP